MRKHISPKKAIAAKGIPKRGMSKRNLELLGRLQERDLGADKSMQRLMDLKWNLRHKKTFFKIVGSFPKELRECGLSLLDQKEVYFSLKKLFAAERAIGRKKLCSLVYLLLFKHPDHSTRRYTLQGVGASKAVYLFHFVEKALKDRDPQVRRTALWTLGELNPRRSIPIIEKALSDPDDNTRISAIMCLGELRSVHSVPLLEKALFDDYSEIRIKAAEALLEIKSVRSVPLIEKLLYTEKNSYTRKDVAKALRKFLEIETDLDYEVRCSAGFCLRHIAIEMNRWKR